MDTRDEVGHLGIAARVEPAHRSEEPNRRRRDIQCAQIIGERHGIAAGGPLVGFCEAKLAGELLQHHRGHERLGPGERVGDGRADGVAQGGGEMLGDFVGFHRAVPPLGPRCPAGP